MNGDVKSKPVAIRSKRVDGVAMVATSDVALWLRQAAAQCTGTRRDVLGVAAEMFEEMEKQV